MRETWRLLDLAFGDGRWNMAVDEAILSAVASALAPPTLRIYGWARPCVSVGCTQAVADLDLATCERQGLPVLRRASGGTAVLHADTLAYSLVLPAGHWLAVPDIVESYRLMGPPVLLALRRLGVEARLVEPDRAHGGGRATGFGSSACFARLAPYEVVYDGKKLVGNSQLRRRGGVLHHALLHLDFEPGRLARLLATATGDERARLTAYLAARVGSLAEAAGRTITPEAAASALAAGFSEGLEVSLETGGLTSEETAEAGRLVAEKFGNPAWTHRR